MPTVADWENHHPAAAFFRKRAVFLLLVVMVVPGAFGGANSRRAAIQAIATASSEKPATIPFESLSTLVLLPVSINSGPPLTFILDTGANADVIDSAAAEKAGLKLEGHAKGRGSGGGTFEVRFVKNVTIHLPGVEYASKRVAAADLSSIRSVCWCRVEGVLGAPFFEHYVVQIDYKAGVLRIFDPGSFSPPAGSASLPIHFSSGKPHVHAQITLASGRKVEDDFLIDTGKSEAVDHPAVEENAVIHDAPGVGIAGDVTGAVGRLKEFRLGPYVVTNVVAANWGKRFGGEICRRFRLTFDYSQHQVVLEPNEHLHDPTEYDMTGMSVRLVPEGLEIHSLLNNSPAQEAGLKRGDVLTDIDGVRATKFSFAQLREMFRQEGREHSMTVKRGAETVQARVKTRRMI